MQKLLFFSFLFLAQNYIALNAMEKAGATKNQHITIGGVPVKAEVLWFELYCRDILFFKHDKNKVLEYIANRDNDINKQFDGDVVIGDEKSSMTNDELRLPILHRACITQKDKDIVQALLARGDIDINKLSRNKSTALQYACVNSDAEVVLWLLKHGADVNNVDNNGKTALVDACFHQKISIVKLLLSHEDTNINKGMVRRNTIEGETPLFFAARWSTNLLNAFLDSGKVQIHQKNDLNQTWFYIAWYHGLLGSDESPDDESNDLYNDDAFNVLNIFTNWGKYQKGLFLNQELHALTKMLAMLCDKKCLLQFIRFCKKSGANLQKKNKRGKRPVDSIYDVYRTLKPLISANNEEMIVKEQILHALLFETSPALEESEEYGIERTIAFHVVDNPESYDYHWNKQQKKAFRQNLLQAMALKNQGDNQ
jgi:hypothetical protein